MRHGVANGASLLVAVTHLGSRARPPARLAGRAGMGRGEKMHPAEISRVACTPVASDGRDAHADDEPRSVRASNGARAAGRHQPQNGYCPEPLGAAVLSDRGGRNGPNMPLILDPAAFQTRLAALPVATYQVGETVLAAGTTSGRLLVLKTGAVEVMKDGMQIAEVSEPGAVFGELSMLLDQPHTADVRALEVTEFHVADAASLLTDDPATATLRHSAPRAASRCYQPSPDRSQAPAPDRPAA